MNELNDLETTEIITFINESARNNLVTRSTLNVLNIRIALKADMALLPPDMKVNSTKEIRTIPPSKMFIVSLR
jgi:hypothetical protein